MTCLAYGNYVYMKSEGKIGYELIFSILMARKNMYYISKNLNKECVHFN